MLLLKVHKAGIQLLSLQDGQAQECEDAVRNNMHTRLMPEHFMTLNWVDNTPSAVPSEKGSQMTCASTS